MQVGKKIYYAGVALGAALLPLSCSSDGSPEKEPAAIEFSPAEHQAITEAFETGKQYLLEQGVDVADVDLYLMDGNELPLCNPEDDMPGSAVAEYCEDLNTIIMSPAYPELAKSVIERRNEFLDKNFRSDFYLSFLKAVISHELGHAWADSEGLMRVNLSSQKEADQEYFSHSEFAADCIAGQITAAINPDELDAVLEFAQIFDEQFEIEDSFNLKYGRRVTSVEAGINGADCLAILRNLYDKRRATEAERLLG